MAELWDLAATNTTTCDTGSGGAANDWLMGLLGLGNFLSFTPTWYAMIANQSNEGISVTAMLILNLNNVTATLGLLFLNWSSLQCCRDTWGFTDCLIGINPILLIGAGLLGSFPMYALSVWFRDSVPYTAVGDGGNDAEAGAATDAHSNASERGATSPHNRTINTSLYSVASSKVASVVTHNEVLATDFSPTSRVAALVGMVAFTVFSAADMVAGLLLVNHYGAEAHTVHVFGQVNNVFAAIFMSLCWFPQIYHTYQLKDSVNLSILMLLIQAPGSAAIVVTLLLGAQDLTTVASNLASFVAQSILLVMCIVYELRKRKALGGEEGKALDDEQNVTKFPTDSPRSQERHQPN